MLRMRSAYRNLAYAIDALIIVQAAAIAWAIFGEGKYIEDGHNVNKALEDSDTLPFPEVVGFIVHGLNGEILIPLVAIALLIVSFFAKVPEGPKWAGMLLGGIVIQILLAVLGGNLPVLGILHGANALLLFWLAFRAAKQAGVASATAPEATAVA
jgi:hypothetical protein